MVHWAQKINWAGVFGDVELVIQRQSTVLQALEHHIERHQLAHACGCHGHFTLFVHQHRVRRGVDQIDMACRRVDGLGLGTDKECKSGGNGRKTSEFHQQTGLSLGLESVQLYAPENTDATPEKSRMNVALIGHRKIDDGTCVGVARLDHALMQNICTCTVGNGADTDSVKLAATDLNGRDTHVSNRL